MTTTQSTISRIIWFLLALFISGCGGGSGSMDTPRSAAIVDVPVLKIGPVLNLSVGSSIIISSNQELKDLTSITVNSNLDGSIPVATSIAVDNRSITVTPKVLVQSGAILTVAVTATNRAGVSGSANGTVATQQILITACKEITSGGRYLLQGDISINSDLWNTACINIHDTGDVHIDCANHLVTGPVALAMENVQKFTVQNCKLRTALGSLGDMVKIVDSIEGVFTENEITTVSGQYVSSMLVNRTKRSTFKNNTLVGTFQHLYGEDNIISNNRITTTRERQLIAGLVVTAWSVNTKIIENTLDGDWDSVRPSNQMGADDGILAQDETRLLIRDNVIKNVWDCGIETSGKISYSTISKNQIENAAYCGIGGWYWSSIIGLTIEKNNVIKSGNLFYFFRHYGLRPAGVDKDHIFPADTEVLFTNNVFDGNNLIDPISLANFGIPKSADIQLYDNLQYAGSVSSFIGELPAPLTSFKLSNNIFRNNNFGRAFEAPYFGVKTPIAGVVIDGGGNICKPPTTPNYPLHCN